MKKGKPLVIAGALGQFFVLPSDVTGRGIEGQGEIIAWLEHAGASSEATVFAEFRGSLVETS